MKKSARQLIISVIATVIVALVFGYLLGRKAHAPESKSQEDSAASVFDWNSKLPEVKDALAEAFPNERIGERSDVLVSATANVEGDQTPEALVLLGTGGASTDYMALVSWRDGKIFVARTGTKLDSAPLLLLEGAAVRHSDDAGLEPSRSMAYQIEKLYGDDGSLSSCIVDEYTWNASTGLYDHRSVDSASSKDSLWTSNCIFP